ncbi:MAG: hypothetical protein KA296_17535 [Marinobacter sp.]|nr:hypothetical protein [Marinobacter sp.]
MSHIRRRMQFTVLAGLLCSGSSVWASDLTIPNTFVSGEKAVAAEVNSNFSAVELAVDDNNALINSNATVIDDNATRINALESKLQTSAQIQHLSWTHDGVMAPELTSGIGFAMAFSRPVLPQTVSATLVFEVLYRDIATSTWKTVTDIEVAALSAIEFDADNVIVAAVQSAISTEPVEGITLRSTLGPLADGLYRIRFNGDFVSDEQGFAVDGDHLLGRLPSGDGVPGGAFESWVRVQ